MNADYEIEDLTTEQLKKKRKELDLPVDDIGNGEGQP
jgi:hypothetical protein